MTFEPKLINLRSTTIFKAFLVNSIVIAIVATLTIEIKDKLDDRDTNLSSGLKLLITALSSAVIAFVSYVIARYCFAFGEGMLAAKGPPYPTLF